MAIQRVTVLGLGNIGGSLALALTSSDQVPAEVVGYARRQANADEALRLGAVDRATTDLADAVAGADLVVLATPVAAMEHILQAINPHLRKGAVVTDVGSTKVEVNAWGRACIGPAAHFVGGHPMAGSAAAGIGGADGELFQDSVFCVVPADDTPAGAIAVVEQLVAWLGARPLLMSAAQHDHYVAAVSHLPMLLSSMLVSYAAGSEEWEAMSQLAALGFREMTRMAAGSAEVRRSICSTNKVAIAGAIDGMIATMQDYRQRIAQDDDSLLALLEQARDERKQWVVRRYPK